MTTTTQYNTLRQEINNFFKTKSKESRDKITTIVKTLDTKTLVNDTNYFAALVPATGRADTVAGEIVRAFHKIDYRYFNSGDIYFEGYGIETCGSASVYLGTHTNKLIENLVINLDLNEAETRHVRYENFLETLAKAIATFLRANPALYLTRNTTDSVSGFDKEAEELYQELDTYFNEVGSYNYYDDGGYVDL